MYFAFTSRETLLDFLPKGGVCAEIGVKRGEFSGEMLRRLSPAKLHLVDLWQHQVDTAYITDAGNVEQDVQDGYHREVVEVFGAKENVEIHRTSSLTAAASFPENYFDFVYLDAMHTHDAVLGDLRAYAGKMKPSGILAGHDFCSQHYARNQGFGVIGAVTEFVKQSDYEFLLITGELWATFLLVKRHQDGIKLPILSQFLVAGVPFLELPDTLAPALHQRVYQLSNGEYRMHAAFGL